MGKLDFAYPAFFYLLALLPLMAGWYLWRGRKSTGSLTISGFENLDERSKSARIWLRHLLFIMRMSVVGLIVLVLARPQSSNQWEQVTTEGIDIVMCMDVSGSMRAMDFRPNRLEASKNVGIEFVNARQNDRFGLVLFAGESFTQCPMTTDRAVVINFMKEVDFGVIEDGTPLEWDWLPRNGSESRAVSKVIILLTDGVNNRGDVEWSPPPRSRTLESGFTPLRSNAGYCPRPVEDTSAGRGVICREIDEDVLKKIAATTGGTYFRATDSYKLREILPADRPDGKNTADEGSVKRRGVFPLLAALLMLLKILLRYTFFRAIPWDRLHT
jgi:Ca-activated chloride channel family protein